MFSIPAGRPQEPSIGHDEFQLPRGQVDRLPSLLLVPLGRAVVRYPVKEIGRAIQRVDDPSKFSVGFVKPRLFSEDAMVRIGLLDRFDDDGFRVSIDVRDQIVPILLFHQQFIHTIDGAANDLTSATGSPQGDVDHWLHGRVLTSAFGRGMLAEIEIEFL